VKPQTQTSRNAFTLLELLVSSVLTAILMVALLSLLRSVARTSRQVEQLQVATASKEILESQLTFDLKNARGARKGPNELVLFGFLARDRNGMPTLQPSYVGYKIQPVGLVRWQSATPSPRASDKSDRTLIWHGAANMTAHVDTPIDDSASSDIVKLQAGGLLPMSARARFLIHDTAGRLITEVSVSQDPEEL
jgi:prepilin-type N-terminal cleavage/methylation domain-containing protein